MYFNENYRLVFPCVIHLKCAALHVRSQTVVFYVLVGTVSSSSRFINAACPCVWISSLGGGMQAAGYGMQAGESWPVGWALVIAVDVLSGDQVGTFHCLGWAMGSPAIFRGQLPASQPAGSDLAWAPASVLLFLLLFFGECNSIITYVQNTTELWAKIYYYGPLFSRHILRIF